MSIPGYPESSVRTPNQTRALVEVIVGHDLQRMMIVHGRSYAEVQAIRDGYRLTAPAEGATLYPGRGDTP